MANLETVPTSASTEPASVPGLLISLAPLAPDAMEPMLANLAAAFPGQTVTVITPDSGSSVTSPTESIRLVPYAPAAASSTNWYLTAAEFLNTYKFASDHKAATCLLLGTDAQTLHPAAIRELALAAGKADLAVASYDLNPRESLVNSAILYPVIRAVYGARPRFPLALDLGLSLRMAERLAMAAQRYTALNQEDALLWPTAEAAVANLPILEVSVGQRTLPQPKSPDLNSLLNQVTGSLFADIELKASFWQRARGVQPQRVFAETAAGVSMPDVQPMLDSFRLAYTNLHEIWSLVLPPNSLLGLKKLSLMPPNGFYMPEALWARIVYDFILAWRLRTINRGHLLGALTPLYLAWVASHVVLANSGTAPEAHVEAQAAAFEADKPYLVSRWRWPDRFNP